MESLGVLLPISIAVAFSTVPILAMIVLLLSPRGQVAGLGFLLGYAVGLACVTVGFTAGIRAIPMGGYFASAHWIAVGEVLLGVICVVIAVWSFRRARRAHRAEGYAQKMPAWLVRVGKLGPVAAFGVGLVMNVRPKALVLATAAALAFNADGLTPVDWLVGTLVYLALGLSTVAAPVIVVWRNGERSREVLERTHQWLERNSYIVTSTVILMVGVVLIGDGLTRL